MRRGFEGYLKKAMNKAFKDQVDAEPGFKSDGVMSSISDWLPEVADKMSRFNGETAPDRLRPISRALSCNVNEIPERIFVFLNQLNVGSLMREYVEIDVVEGLGDDLITRARAANNIRDIDGAIAR